MDSLKHEMELESSEKMKSAEEKHREGEKIDNFCWLIAHKLQSFIFEKPCVQTCLVVAALPVRAC